MKDGSIPVQRDAKKQSSKVKIDHDFSVQKRAAVTNFKSCANKLMTLFYLTFTTV